LGGDKHLNDSRVLYECVTKEFNLEEREEEVAP
jgi:hypothetical protein